MIQYQIFRERLRRFIEDDASKLIEREIVQWLGEHVGGQNFVCWKNIYSTKPYVLKLMFTS